MAATPFSHTNSKGTTYYLFSKEVVLRGDHHQKIFWFSKSSTSDKGTPVEALPAGMIVKENPRNGFVCVAREK